MKITEQQISLFCLKAQKYTSFILIFFVISSFLAKSQESSPFKYNLPYNPKKELKTDLDLLLHNSKYDNSLLGLSVWSLDREEFLYQYNSNKNYVPASLTKLVTSSSALFFLGSEYQYKTSLYITGEVLENGDLLGDLIIQSNGSPSNDLSGEDPNDIFFEWIYILDSLGIKSIQGDIIADDSWFDNDYFGEGWAWDDLKYDYGSSVSSINYNNNSFEIKIYPGVELGGPAQLRISPESSYYNIINNIVVGEFDDIKFKREEGTNIIELTGTIDIKRKSPKTLNVSVDNPSGFLLYRFKEVLRKNNIRFRGELYSYHNSYREVDYDNAALVSITYSKPLKEILKKVNKESINLYAEILLKTIAREKTGLGSFDKGIYQIEKLMEDISISPNDFELKDGSGLSRMNFISPDNIIKVLNFSYKQKWFNDFRSSLAVPGEEGTMKFRLNKTSAKDKVWVKTGTMNAVSNLAGIIETRDGELLAFCFMMNNFTQTLPEIRNLQDLVVMRLSSFSRIPPVNE